MVQGSLSTMVQWSICNAGGSTRCPLFHMSLPNTFPFTLAVSFCHWGLPHGDNHVPWRVQIILPPLSDISQRVYTLGGEKNWEERRERSIKPNICVLCRSPFVLMTYFISTSCSRSRLPMAGRSTLEFSPHHPTTLWPSNSQPLWPEQINNKPGTFCRSSGEKQMDGVRAPAWLPPTFPVVCFPEDKINMLFIKCFYSTVASF